MDLYDYTENAELAALARACSIADANGSVTKEEIEQCLKNELGEGYESDGMNNGYYGLFDSTDGIHYTPNFGTEFNVRFTQVEKESIKAALQDERAQLFLDERTMEELSEKLSDVPSFWNNSSMEMKVSGKEKHEDRDLGKKLKILTDCIRKQKAVKVTNHTEGKGDVTSLLYPLRLEYTADLDLWTLNAWQPEEERAINLNVRRIDPEITAEDSVPEDIERKYASFLKGKKHSCVLRIPMKNYAADMLFRRFSYYERQIRFDREGKYYEMTLWYYDFDKRRLMENILAGGQNILVLKPEMLRRKVIARIQGILSVYEKEAQL